MIDFRKCLKPGVQRFGGRYYDDACYRGVLRYRGIRLWTCDRIHDAMRMPASEARQRALEDAESLLHCDDGSLIAEELTELVQAYCTDDGSN